MLYTSQRLSTQTSGWKVFAERRLVRIVPLYWLATTLKLLTMVASPTLALHNRPSVLGALCSYLFLPFRNLDGMFRPLLGVGYTLNYEMFFYLLFTLALAWRLPPVRAIGVVLFALTIASFLHGPTGPSVLFYADSIVLDFFWGMLAAHLYMTGKHPRQWPIAIVLMLAGWYLLFALTPFRPTVGLGAGLIVFGIALLEPHLQRTPRLILYLADASYAIYLFHSLVMPSVPILLAHLHKPYLWLSFFASATVGILIGCIAHQFIELPITRYLRDHLRFRNQPIIHLPETPLTP
jgi:exopolysaccharide production protein ExoZ